MNLKMWCGGKQKIITQGTLSMERHGMSFSKKTLNPQKNKVLQQRDIIEKQVWSNAPTGEIPTY